MWQPLTMRWDGAIYYRNAEVLVSSGGEYLVAMPPRWGRSRWTSHRDEAARFQIAVWGDESGVAHLDSHLGLALKRLNGRELPGNQALCNRIDAAGATIKVHRSPWKLATNG